MSTMEKLIEETPVTWTCRFHSIDWWHEIGCPHKEWTKEELQSVLETKKRFEQSKLEGTILT